MQRVLIKLNICLLIHDENFLLTNNKVLNKVNNITQKGFDNELVHNEKYLKTKIKFYCDKINIWNAQRRFSLCLFISNTNTFPC